MSQPVVQGRHLGQHGDRLRSFYAEVLGWPLAADPGRTDVRAGVIAAREGTPVSVDEVISSTRSSMFYARVPDLAAALDRARAHGSRVLVPPTLLRTTVVAVVSDPDGNPVGLCT